MPRRSWTDTELIAAIADSISVSEVLRKLNLKPVGSNYKTVYLHSKRLSVSLEHLKGQAWSRGKTGTTGGMRKDLEEILVEDSTYTNTSFLKSRLVRAGFLVDVCYICGISEWLNKPLTLQLDHINGRNLDNRIQNLRLLCPNCHAQTPTYRNRSDPDTPTGRENSLKQS